MSSPFDEPEEVSKFEVAVPTEIRVSLRAGSTASAPFVHVQGTPSAVAEALASDTVSSVLELAAEKAARFEKIYTKARDTMDSLSADRTLGKPDGASDKVPVDMPFADEVKECKHGVMTRREAGGKVGYICKLKLKDKNDPEACASIMVG